MMMPLIMIMVMLSFQPHQSTKCTQHVGFKLHVACPKMLLPLSKPKANVQNPFIAKLNPQQGNQLACSIQKQKVKEMSFKKNFSEKFQDSLCQFLSRTGQLKDFLYLTKGLIEETVDPDDMAWKAVLYLGRYAACLSTTSIRCHEEYIDVLALLNILYGLPVLNILRGPADFGTNIWGV